MAASRSASGDAGSARSAASRLSGFGYSMLSANLNNWKGFGAAANAGVAVTVRVSVRAAATGCWVVAQPQRKTIEIPAANSHARVAMKSSTSPAHNGCPPPRALRLESLACRDRCARAHMLKGYI
jgi:hypothetical protein